MTTDSRYSTVKKLIRSKDIKQFKDIFDIIPVSVVAGDTGLNPSRLNTLIKEVGNMRAKNIIKIAELIDVPENVVFELIVNQHRKTK